MSDPFFRKPRPFTKRKRDEKDSRQGVGKKRSSQSKAGSSKVRRKDERREDEAEDEDLKAIEEQEDSDDAIDEADGVESDDDDRETPAQKRLRLSKMYLESLQKEQEDEFGFDAADLDRDLIADRLQRDVLEHDGRLHLRIGRYLPKEITNVYRTARKGHRGCVTSAVASLDGAWLYTGSKDGSIIKWRLNPALDNGDGSSSAASSEPGSSNSLSQTAYFRKAYSRHDEQTNSASEKGKEKAPQGHTDEVLTLAISHDGKILASGSKDRSIGAWNVEGDAGHWLRALSGHRDAVSSVAFRLGTRELFSASHDRTVKLFDMSTLAYVETFFGHQDCIQDIDALRAQVAVTGGGRDKTVRYWKVMEESQLVFRGGGTSKARKVLDNAMDEDVTAIGEEDNDESRKRKAKAVAEQKSYVEGAIDCVAMVDDTTFVSGGDSGTLSLWTTTKKKPIFSVNTAHGIHEHESATEGIIGLPRWITAVASVPYGDVFASGSYDGQIRIWKIDERGRSFSLVSTIAAHGVVNQLQLVHLSQAKSERTLREDAGSQGQLLVVAAVGREHRLGRWLKTASVREGGLVAVVPLSDK